MILVRLLFWCEFTLVPSCSSVLVYMIPIQNLKPEHVIPVPPVTVPEQEFPSGMKTHPGLM